MTDTPNLTLAGLVTDDELLLIGRASAMLEALSDRCVTAAWNTGTRWSDKPRAQDIGRLAGIAAFVSDALFDVANVAHNYVGIEHAVEAFNTGARAHRDEPAATVVTMHPGWSVKS